jgi:hypothetical protein
MELWVKHSKSTILSSNENDLYDIMLNLEEDANSLLEYIASDGLVTNPN